MPLHRDGRVRRGQHQGGLRRLARDRIPPPKTKASDNLLSVAQSRVEIDASGFTNRYGSGSVGHTKTVAAEGNGSLVMTKNSSAGTLHSGTSPRPKVVPNNFYGARVSVRAATTGRAQLIRFVWRDAAGAETTVTGGSGDLTTSATTGWTDLSFKRQAPSDAVDLQIQIEIRSCAAGEQHYADKWGLWDLGETSDLAIPPWTNPEVAAPGLVHAVTRTTSPNDALSQRLLFGHVMTNTHPSSDDKHYQLIYQGTVTSAAALPSGLVLADHGKAWKATDTNDMHMWTGTAWKNHGTRPAYNVVGAKYPNPDDFWYKHFLPPARGGDAHDQAIFGENVNAPPYMPRRGGTTDNWYIQNAKQYIRDAIRLGCDGFGIYMNQIGDSSVHWPRTMRYVRAAEQVWDEDGTPFLCILQPDGTTSATASVKIDSSTVNIDASADALANQILKVASNKALLKVGNKIVVAPFGPDRWPRGITQTSADRLVFWTRFKKTMAAGGWPVYFVPMFLGMYTGFLDNGWDAIVEMPSLWGDRDPITTSGTLNSTHALRNTEAVGRTLTKYGLPFFFTVAPGDQRRRQGTLYEEGGWDNLRQMWKNAIGVPGSSLYRRADWVHYVTWNDYPEGSEADNSLLNGDAVADFGRYYQEWWRTGKEPAILRDGLYLRHRIHFFNGTTYTGLPEVGKTTPLYHQTDFIDTRRGATSVRDEISVEARLTAEATVEILVGTTVVKSQVCPAGVTPVRAPMSSGDVSVRAVRNGTVVSRVVSSAPISTTQPHQDLLPRSFSSLRQGT